MGRAPASASVSAPLQKALQEAHLKDTDSDDGDEDNKDGDDDNEGGDERLTCLRGLAAGVRDVLIPPPTDVPSRGLLPSPFPQPAEQPAGVTTGDIQASC